MRSLITLGLLLLLAILGPGCGDDAAPGATLTVEGRISSAGTPPPDVGLQTSGTSCEFSCEVTVSAEGDDQIVLQKAVIVSLVCQDGFPINQSFVILQNEPVALSGEQCNAVMNVDVTCTTGGVLALELINQFSGSSQVTFSGCEAASSAAVDLTSLLDQGVQIFVLTCASLAAIDIGLSLICEEDGSGGGGGGGGGFNCGNGVVDSGEECDFEITDPPTFPPTPIGCEDCVAPGSGTGNACTCGGGGGFCDLQGFLQPIGLALGCTTCGDAICSAADGESDQSCPQDCVRCGNEQLDEGEDCDLSAPDGDTCDSGFCIPPDAPPNIACTCENFFNCDHDGVCDEEEDAFFCYDDCCGDGICRFGDIDSCPDDCDVAATCGDNDCDSVIFGEGEEPVVVGEGPCNCPQDCVATLASCGDGTCNDRFEDPNNCPTDCPLSEASFQFCNPDGICDGTIGERCDTCPQDCVFSTNLCGNRLLNPGETCDDGNNLNGDGCNAVCRDETSGAICPNEICETGEGNASCPADCPP